MRSIVWKPAFIFLVFCFLAFEGFAQHKYYLAINSGYSFPQNDFLGKDVQGKSGGYAKPGPLAELNFGYLFSENIGFTALIRGQQHNFNTSSYIESLNFRFNDSTWAVEATQWEGISFLTGLYTSFPITNITNVNGRAVLGGMNLTSPEIKTTATNVTTNATGTQIQKSSSTLAFSYMIGMGLQFNLGKRFTIFTNGDYFVALPRFNKIEVVTYDGTVSSNSLTLDIGAFSLSAGLGFRF